MKLRKRSHWIIALIIALLQMGFIAALFSQWGYDDVFITFRYAENLFQGIGFVYNSGERVLSTTTPFFTILLAILRYLSSDLSRLATAVGIISLSAGGLFLWDLSYTYRHPLTAWYSLLIYPIFPLLLNTLSAEMPLFLALCLGALAFYARSRFSTSSCLIAVACLTRPEGVLLGSLLLIHYLCIERKIPSWQHSLPFFLIVSPWIVFTFLYFGSPIPATLAAKQAQGTMSISQRFAPGLLTILNRGYSSRWQYWIIGILSIVGISSILQPDNQKRWILPAWAAFHFVALSILGVTAYFWYYSPTIPGLLALSGFGLENLLISLQKWLSMQFKTAISVGFSTIILLVLTMGKHSLEQSQFPDQRLQIYQVVGEWIQAYTDENVTVGSLEVGIVGYYARRTMVDFAGIIQPAIAKKLTPSTTYQDSMIWAVETYHPDILVLKKNQIPETLEKIVDDRCETRILFKGVEYDYSGDLWIVQCEW